MPTFTAIALDRLLEPGASKSVDKSVASSNLNPKPKLPPKTRSASKSNLERSNSIAVIERRVNRPQISPALYATPEATPLPDSPTSFTPSPYIINHKRRGPRLLKSFSEDDVARRKNLEEKVNGSGKSVENEALDSTNKHSVTFTVCDSVEERQSNGVQDSLIKQGLPHAAGEASTVKEQRNGVHSTDTGCSSGDFKIRIERNGSTPKNHVPKLVAPNSGRDVESDDFFEPKESVSYNSNTDGEDNSALESSGKLSAVTPIGEFYDALEELSSDSGLQSSFRDIEAELREMRLNLLMEIDKRKLAEETLSNAQNQWQRMREQLVHVGLTLPVFPCIASEGELLLDTDPAEQLSQQIYLARFVSDAVGRGIAKAEAEMEKEAQIEAKNFEIARLCDRLQYYEAMNREMSQRNQAAVEMARRNRQVQKRRQRWVWGSVAAAVALGSTALAWSYFPATRGSSSTDVSLALEHDDGSK